MATKKLVDVTKKKKDPIYASVALYLKGNRGKAFSTRSIAEDMGLTNSQVASAIVYLREKGLHIESAGRGVWSYGPVIELPAPEPAKSDVQPSKPKHASAALAIATTDVFDGPGFAGDAKAVAEWLRAETAGEGITAQTKFWWIGYRVNPQGERYLLLRGDNGKIYTAEEL